VISPHGKLTLPVSVEPVTLGECLDGSSWSQLA
jgi:hypothetical protein